MPDVVPYLRGAHALLVPLEAGGGTRLKILEAFACQTPVVSTTLGAEGLDVEHGRHLLLADDAPTFADAVLSLVGDPGFAERLIGPADIEPTRRHLEIIGEHNIDTLRTDLDRGRTVDGFGDCFKGDPTSGIPGHRPAIETKVEDFLHPRRVQHRDAGIHKGVFGLMRQCRGFAGVIVAGKKKHPAMRRRPGSVAVL